MKPMYSENAKTRWKAFKAKPVPIAPNDIRRLELMVDVVFEWSDEIIAEYDYDTNTVLEYTSGYIMKVLSGQSSVYQGQDTSYIASAFQSQDYSLRSELLKIIGHGKEKERAELMADQIITLFKNRSK